jgi:uncharacterized protein (DUF433 family)
MNDKDLEAFDKWRSSQLNRPDIYDAWEFACHYMRNKSTPLDALSLYEKLEKEREENKKLRNALEFYSDIESGNNDWGMRAREALKEIGDL